MVEDRYSWSGTGDSRQAGGKGRAAATAGTYGSGGKGGSGGAGDSGVWKLSATAGMPASPGGSGGSGGDSGARGKPASAGPPAPAAAVAAAEEALRQHRRRGPSQQRHRPVPMQNWHQKCKRFRRTSRAAGRQHQFRPQAATAQPVAVAPAGRAVQAAAEASA